MHCIHVSKYIVYVYVLPLLLHCKHGGRNRQEDDRGRRSRGEIRDRAKWRQKNMTKLDRMREGKGVREDERWGDITADRWGNVCDPEVEQIELTVISYQLESLLLLLLLQLMTAQNTNVLLCFIHLCWNWSFAGHCSSVQSTSQHFSEVRCSSSSSSSLTEKRTSNSQ